MIQDLNDGMEFNKITVRLLCQQTGLNRSTFYSHFPDTEEVLVHIYDTMRLDMAEATSAYSEKPEYLTDPDFYIASLKKMKKNRRIMLASRNVRNRMPIFEGHDRTYQQDFKPYMQRHGITDEKGILYRFIFFQSGWLAIANDWIDHGCIEPEEEIAQIVVSCVKGQLPN